MRDLSPWLESAPEGLLEAFDHFEHALASGDPATVAHWWVPGSGATYAGPEGLVIGSDLITSMATTAHSEPPARDGQEIGTFHLLPIDGQCAVITLTMQDETGAWGSETQVWVSRDDTWLVTAIHTSPPGTQALDTRVWRAVGDPLVPGTPDGPLSGEAMAVSDLLAVAGQQIGAGSPAWLANASAEDWDATVVSALLNAGADLRGICRTDELGWSAFGVNPHYGTAPNPQAPRRVPGGAASGAASAVALGHASIGVGLDTGGSLQVPAAYQGLYCLRTTHASLSRDRVVPLSPTFDAIGWLARDSAVLAATGDVLVPPSLRLALDRDHNRVVVVPELLSLAAPDVAEAVGDYARELGATEESWDLGELESWVQAFVTVQAAEAWQEHREWLAECIDDLSPAVRVRFLAGAAVPADAAAEAAATVVRAGETVRKLVADRFVVLPAAPSVAPRLDADLAAAEAATLRLTCFASLGGLPALTVPVTGPGLPRAACLLAAQGRDRDLLALAVRTQSSIEPGGRQITVSDAV
ncbi:amidase family protein [Nocardioides sp.]|uniref:amidase family protein n=1 Tax=Nocardioides sp. TaxID=35761 RepID=UPI00286BEB0D|nr:amidase family protein [Nocardioides sp.]